MDQDDLPVSPLVLDHLVVRAAIAFRAAKKAAADEANDETLMRAVIEAIAPKLATEIFGALTRRAEYAESLLLQK